MYFSSLKIVRRRRRSAKKTAKKITNFIEVSFKVLIFFRRKKILSTKKWRESGRDYNFHGDYKFRPLYILENKPATGGGGEYQPMAFGEKYDKAKRKRGKM
jgi:hypothetical protein